MPNASSKMLTPEDRSALANLQLLARSVVEGITVGRHRSPHKGASIEFKEHRQYVKGDEIRSIDWKLYGKTDRLYIRQYEDETNLRSMILLDQSGSMAYRGSRSSLSKHEFGKRLAACISTLLISQQDAVGVCTFDTEVREMIPARSRANHLRAVHECLVTSRTAGETKLSEVLQQVAAKVHRRSLLILISDCFDQVDPLMKALAYFRHAGSEAVIFQVWDQDEIDFPFQRRTQFRNLESLSQQRLVDPQGLRQQYLQRVEEFRASLGQCAAHERIDLIPCTTDQSYATVLANYIARRSGNSRGARS
jgi:uncharacterized protein (DUF58 family)